MDTSPTVVKFPALAVLLMVNVLPMIPVAELSRPRATWAALLRHFLRSATGAVAGATLLSTGAVDNRRGQRARWPVQRGREPVGPNVLPRPGGAAASADHRPAQ